jgi:hypothetical protein
MSLVADVRAMFPESAFGPACTDLDIALAEKRLGHRLPSLVADMYRSFDGIRGPTNAQFLYPLNKAPSETSASLVDHTLFLRGEDYFPSFLKRAVAIGDMGTGPCWLILLDEPTKVALWDGEWGEDYERLDGSIVDVWRAATLLYKSFENQS